MLDGFVEGLEVEPNFVFVQGWIDVRPTDSTCQLLVYGADVVLGSGVITDFFDRPDLGSTDAHRKAFRCTVALSSTWTGIPLTVCLATADRNVELPQLNPSKQFEGRGQLEDVAGWGISGWVWDPRATHPSLQFDDSARIEVPLTVKRDDLPPSFVSGRNNGFHLTYCDINALARSAISNFAILDGRPHDISLFSGESLVASLRVEIEREYRGKVEAFATGILRGWACATDGSDDSAMVDICIAGTRYITCSAAFDRSDLVRLGFVKKGGGFRAIVHELESTNEDRKISVRYHLNGKQTPGAVFPAPERRAFSGRATNITEFLPEKHPNISIIIPVYNAASDLEHCLESLTRNTTMPCRLIIIDDASPDPQIKKLLSRYKSIRNIVVVHSDNNAGFTKTINKGIAIADTDDVVLLNSDTVVTPRWLENLYLAAYHRPYVSTVTPLSNNAGAFSVPEIGIKNVFPAALDNDDGARLITHASAVDYPEVPTGNGFCMYVRRKCIETIGNFDEVEFPIGYGEENDFCQRAQRHGFSNVVDDRTLVYHVRSASFLDKKAGHYSAGRAKIDRLYPEYNKQIKVFRDGPAFLELRWRVRKMLETASAGKTKIRPRILFVIATQTGGTPQTNRDLMSAIEESCEPYLLRCDSKQIFLDKFEQGQDLPLHRHRLRQEISISLHRSNEYDRTVGELLVRYAVELVHVRHIAWHSLGLIRICKKLSIPVVFSFHDFYTVCPNIKLLDENNVHCGGSCTDTAGRCSAELWPSNTVPPLKQNFVYRWRKMLEDVLHLCDAFVTTAHSAERIFENSFPSLDLKTKLSIIPHGRSFQRMQALAVPPQPGTPLRVLIPGNISGAKGAFLIEEILDLDREALIEFHVVGDGGKLKAGRGLVLHGTYQRDAIAEKVRGIQPHLGAVFSIWPETYCHTLSEMWACGVPVAAFDIGAVGERLAETGGGWLLPLESKAGTVMAELLRIGSDASEIQQKTQNVLVWQRTTGTHYGIAEMADRYLALYRATIDNRKALT